MTHQTLSDFQNRFAACELVLLADISTQTILCSASAVRQGQEKLDAICAMAKSVLDLTSGGPLASAILAQPTGTRIFVRSECDPSEVMCGVFAPASDVAPAIAAAQSLFAATGEPRP